MKITPRELNGVFRLNYGRGTGTCFLYNTEAGCCFATAAHNLAGCVAGDNILLQRDNDWVKVPIQEILFDADGRDVCVFSSGLFNITDLLKPYEGWKGAWIGDNVMFIGFPHDLVNTYPGNGWPSPLVRRACFSGVIHVDGFDVIILDGFNNPGYSGGPVYHTDADGNMALFGVVSGYRFERPGHGRIYKRDENGREEALPDLYVKANSGMIQVISGTVVDDLAKKLKKLNPNNKPPITVC